MQEILIVLLAMLLNLMVGMTMRLVFFGKDNIPMSFAGFAICLLLVVVEILHFSGCGWWGLLIFALLAISVVIGVELKG